jgi:uncharacterized membrane protein YkvA (DUF1232 family)
MAIARWAALRSLANAVRLAVKPGGPGLGERLSSVPRLVRATFRGEYTGTTRGRLLLVAGAILYVISPVDLLPEMILPLVGLADDAVVLSGIAAWLVNETEAYLAWERTTQPGARRGSGASRQGSGSASASSDTVTGHVVP